MATTALNDWLSLVHTRGLGPKTLKKLLIQFSNISHVINANRQDLKKAGINQNVIEQLTNPERQQQAITKELDWAKEKNNHIICIDDESYPNQLKQFDDAPWVLYVKGDVDVLKTLQIAIVGSRNASHHGGKNAYQFAQYLASNGITITSGLALGIDTFAHQGALAGNGLTVAVAATGLDRVYPAKNKDLANQIMQEGAIISEYPLGTQPQAGFFPRRNRIISALSAGTLVVEAALNSGSLITANYALEQGKEVFAIPGSIHDPLAKGCHALIKQGAKLVENAQDIFQELSPSLIEENKKSFSPSSNKPNIANNAVNSIDPEHQKLLSFLEYNYLSVDQIIQLSGMTAQTVSSILLMLELQDLVVSSSGGRYALAPQ